MYELINWILFLLHFGLFIGLLVYGALNPLPLSVGIYGYDASGGYALLKPGSLDIRIAGPFFYLITAMEHLWYIYMYRRDKGKPQKDREYDQMMLKRCNPYRWVFYSASVCPIMSVVLTRVSGNQDITNMMNGGAAYLAMMGCGYLFESRSEPRYLISGTVFFLMPFLSDIIRISIAPVSIPPWVVAIIAGTYGMFASFFFVALYDAYLRSKMKDYKKLEKEEIGLGDYVRVDYAYFILSFVAKSWLGLTGSFALPNTTP
jgi:hypothetical protein